MSAVVRLTCSHALKRPQALPRRPISTVASVLADGSLAARRLTAAAHFPTISASRLVQSSAIKVASSFVPSRTFAGPAVKAVPGSTIPFLLADIGEGIAEVEVLKWFVKAGEHVNQFQKVCEVQSDKATVEITSRYDGVVEKVCYDVGQMAKVGSPLIFLKLSGAADGAATPSTPSPAAPAAASPSPAKPVQTSAAPSEDLSDINDKVLATPATRRLAREHNIDLRRVRATGHDGRVMKEDVLAFLSGAAPPVAPAAAAHPSHPDVSAPSATVKVTSNVPPPTPTPSGPATKPMTQKKQEAMPVYLAQDQVQPVTGIQRAMAAQMTKTVAIPTFLYCDEVLMDELVELRARCKPAAERFGIKLSYFPFIIKAASLALRRYPIVNSHVNADCTQVTLRAAHNIGIAMDTPRGLIVPNIKNVQAKTILEIAADLTRLQALGAEGRLGKEDLTGGTFSLSNIGSVGGTYAGPILNVPEVAIGALGKFQVVPRFNEKKELYPAHILNVSWTGDHRILDGATIASFSNAWKRFLEHPTSMILETK